MKTNNRSIWMNWSVLIIASFVVIPINAVCPGGEQPEAASTVSYYFCATTRDLYDNDECCERKSSYVCKHTGMKSRFLSGDESRFEEGSVYGYWPAFVVSKQAASWKDYVYDSTQDGRPMICPYPIGYLWYTQFQTPDGQVPQKFLPTDHVDTTIKLKTCDDNGDCEVNAFCGDVINRSFHEKYLRTADHTFCTLEKTWGCLLTHDDIPYVDENKHFCYEVPEIVGANVQYWIESTDRNLKLCARDEHCGKGRKCHLTNNINWSAYNRDTDKREDYQGICIESMPISFTLFKIYEKATGEQKKQYLPVKSENKRRSELEPCDKNWDCLDQEFCGHVYSVNDIASMDTTYKYCYNVPEDHPNAFVKPDDVDLMVCNTNEDCNDMTCDTSAQKNFLANINGQQETFKGVCSKTPKQEEEEENDSSLVIIIVILVALIIVIFATLIGGYFLIKRNKSNNCATETTSCEKKNKTTAKSFPVTGKSGMGTTSEGTSPAII